MSQNQNALHIMIIGAEDEENLAIRYLGAVLKEAGHRVSISPCSSYSDFEKTLWDVQRFRPQLIGISIAFQSLALMYFDLAKKIKSEFPDVHIVVGGHFPTFEYKEILRTQEAIDTVGRYEGEQTMVQLAEVLLDRRNIKDVTNLVYRKGKEIHENECFKSFPSLDDLPWPIRNEKPQSRLDEKFATLISSRGCWHSSCLYCCIGAFHAQKPMKFKLRSAESVAAEISDLFHTKGVRFFQFHDDNFMMPSKAATIEHIKDLYHALQKNKVPVEEIAFLIKARPDTVDTEVVKWLKKLGTIGVFLGIENASETGLTALCRRTNISENRKALEVLHANGISATYNLLIFHPKATPKEIRENVLFMNSFKVFPFDFGRAEICAGTPLEAMLKSGNKIKGKWPNWDYQIDNEDVQRMCEIYKVTFRDKQTGYGEMVHQTIALGYNSRLIERLHPGSIQEDLTREANRVIIEVNTFIGKQVEKLSSSLDESWDTERISDFRMILMNGCRRRLKLIESVSTKISRVILAEHVFNKFGIDVQKQSLLHKFSK